jgi:hypothetical protein
LAAPQRHLALAEFDAPVLPGRAVSSLEISSRFLTQPLAVAVGNPAMFGPQRKMWVRM